MSTVWPVAAIISGVKKRVPLLTVVRPTKEFAFTVGVRVTVTFALFAWGGGGTAIVLSIATWITYKRLEQHSPIVCIP